MNREQAKIYLRSSGFSEEQIDTIEQALKKEPYGKLVLSHSEISGQIYAYIGNEKHNITKEAIEAVQAVKALGQQHCEDAISRQAEIVRCKDCRKHNVSVGYKKDCCPLYEFRGISYGHEHDYQFCCFAERRIDERFD